MITEQEQAQRKLDYIKSFFPNLIGNDDEEAEHAVFALCFLDSDFMNQLSGALDNLKSAKMVRNAAIMAELKCLGRANQQEAQRRRYHEQGQFVIDSVGGVPVGKSGKESQPRVGLIVELRGRTPFFGMNHYLIVTPFRNPVDYVQTDPARLAPDGTWTAQAKFGQVAVGAGERFGVRVMATEETLQEGSLEEQYPADGMSSNQLVVVRRE